MTSIKRDDNKKQWEDTEFPLVCETCLGDNPYIRMTKQPYGKACKICETPFTVFAWQAGTTGRLKKVEICQNCARTKNVCQVCIFDLQYGLPVKLRDKMLAEHGSSIVAVPQSDANLSWQKAQQARAIEQGVSGVVPGMAAHLKLQSIARMQPRYERNLPKLCSFFARGECNRGSNCPFRHEAPKDRNDPLSKQNTKDRFYGTNDPVSRKMESYIHAKEKRLAAEQTDSSNATLFVTYSNREYTPEQLAQLPPLTEIDLRDAFYSFGEIASVKILKENKGAFVEYTSSEATELAVNAMNNKDICGRKIFVDFSRASKRGENSDATDGPLSDGQVADNHSNAENVNEVKPVPPPGFKDSSSSSSVLPKGFEPVRPPPSSATISRLSTVPRPGGGVIRRAGAQLSSSASTRPYPSQDPSRLGSKAKI
jgi:pre-mRNA-splicing factor RBM22/SLT11